MYLITTPIPYINGEPHLGHLLEQVVNDTIARYRRRVESQEVWFTVGVDQHGLKNQQKADELGIPVQDFVNNRAKQYKDIWSKYDISYDVFVETSSDNHAIVSQVIFQRLFQKGYIYKKKYDGLYCVGCEDFYAPSQLTEVGECPIHLTKPIAMSEENYFFKLSAFVDSVRDYLENSKILPRSSSLEWLNFCKEGLQDISISRQSSRLSWGVPILIGGEDSGQVMYVWFEALINYLTAVVNPETLDRYRELPNIREEISKEIYNEIKSCLPIDFMYVGKDIAKFHLVVWTAMLTALDLPLPRQALVHGLINDNQGRKFSKTLANGVYPEELLAKFGVDGTRFIILSEVNTIGDTNFDWQKITDSYNSSLANNLGNVLMRVTTLIEKHFGNGNFDLEVFEEDEEVKDGLLDIDLRGVYGNLEVFDCQKAIQELFMQLSKINIYLEDTKPWTLAKDMEANSYRVKQILGLSALSLLEIAKCLSIFLPETGARVVEILSAPVIVKAEVLFPKVEVE
jgi:methionyl-tRNA synthetase